MATTLKQFKKRINRELNESAMQDVADFFKGAFGVKRGSDRQEEIEQIKNALEAGGGILSLEDGSDVEVTQEDAEDLLGFLKVMDYNEKFVDQMFKDERSFNIVKNLAGGAYIFAGE